MSRRKKATEPKSVSWETYRPQDDLYWKLGGPFVPVEEIEPEPHDTRYLLTHLKRPAAKVDYLVPRIAEMRKDLEKSIAYYLKLRELGIDAMEWAYDRDSDRKLEASPGDWTMVARNVDRHRASSYRNIRARSGQIIAYSKLLADLDSQTMPLMSLLKETD